MDTSGAGTDLNWGESDRTKSSEFIGKGEEAGSVSAENISDEPITMADNPNILQSVGKDTTTDENILTNEKLVSEDAKPQDADNIAIDAVMEVILSDIKINSLNATDLASPEAPAAEWPHLKSLEGTFEDLSDVVPMEISSEVQEELMNSTSPAADGVNLLCETESDIEDEVISRSQNDGISNTECQNILSQFDTDLMSDADAEMADSKAFQKESTDSLLSDDGQDRERDAVSLDEEQHRVENAVTETKCQSEIESEDGHDRERDALSLDDEQHGVENAVTETKCQSEIESEDGHDRERDALSLDDEQHGVENAVTETKCQSEIEHIIETGTVQNLEGDEDIQGTDPKHTNQMAREEECDTKAGCDPVMQIESRDHLNMQNLDLNVVDNDIKVEYAEPSATSQPAAVKNIDEEKKMEIEGNHCSNQCQELVQGDSKVMTQLRPSRACRKRKVSDSDNSDVCFLGTTSASRHVDIAQIMKNQPIVKLQRLNMDSVIKYLSLNDAVVRLEPLELNRLKTNTGLQQTSASEDSMKTCPECHRSYQSFRNMQRHFRIAHGLDKMPFRCQNCCQGFVFKRSRDIHLYKCKPKTNTKKHVGVRHEKDSRNKASKFIQTVKSAKMNFKSRNKIQVRLNTSKMAKYRRLCLICAMTFSKTKVLEKHFFHVHIGYNLPFACPICKGRFLTQWRTFNHLKMEHGVLNEDLPDYEVKEEISLKTEKLKDDDVKDGKSKKGGDKMYDFKKMISENCTLSFEEVNVAQTTLECPKCGKKLASKKNLDLHFRTAHKSKNMPFVCCECHRGFLSTGRLINHLTSFHKIHANQIRGYKVYKQEVNTGEADIDVEASTSQKRELASVKKSPFSPKKLKQAEYKNVCPVCIGKFCSLESLELHFRKNHHQYKMPHRCRSCGKDFFSAVRMQRHASLQHKPETHLIQRHENDDDDKLNSNDDIDSTHTLETAKPESQKTMFRNVKTHFAPTKNRSRECPECKKVFVFRNSMVYHFRREHDARKMPFQCNFCEFRFFTSAEKENHAMAVHRTEFTTEAEPLKVPKSFNDHKKLSGTRYNKVCLFCDKKFTELKNLEQHCRNQHPEKKMPYKCKYCPRCYMTSEGVKYHSKLQHPGTVKISGASRFASTNSRKRECPDCKELFASRNSMLCHFRATHGTSKLTSTCKFCHLKFFTVAETKYHISIAHRSKLVAEPRALNTDKFHDEPGKLLRVKRKNMCPICNWKFCSMHSLERHFRSRHRTRKMPYQCKGCRRGFFSAEGEERHRAFNHCKGAEAGVTCESEEDTVIGFDSEQTSIQNSDVTKNNSQKGSMSNKRVHDFSFGSTKHLSSKCPDCGKVFNRRKTMVYHFRKEHDDRKMTHVCKFCPFRFFTETEMKNHVLIVHRRKLPMKTQNLKRSKMLDDAPTAEAIGSIEPQLTKRCPECSVQFHTVKGLDNHFRTKHNESDMPYHCRICKKGFFNRKTTANHTAAVHVSGSTIKNKVPVKQLRVSTKAPPSGAMKQSIATTKVPPGEALKHFRATVKVPHTKPMMHSQGTNENAMKESYMPSEEQPSQTMTDEENTSSWEEEQPQLRKSQRQSIPSQKITFSPAETPRCPECGKGFETFKGRDGHFRKEHSETAMPYNCNLCPMGYFNATNLNNHIIRFHKQHSPAAASQEPTKKVLKCVSCPACSKLLNTQKSRDNHYRSVHGEDSMPLHCHICHRGYFNKSTLTIHYSKIHHVPKLESRAILKNAPDFNETFIFKVLEMEDPAKPSSSVAEQTETAVDENAAAGFVFCSQCLQVFNSQEKRNEHVRTAHKKKRYPCSVCGQCFQTDSILQLHTSRAHTNDSVESVPEGLQVPSVPGTSESLLNPETLTDLGDPLKTKAIAQKLKIKYGIKKQHCPKCGVGFSTSSGRLKHFRRYHGDDLMPHKCITCKKGYFEKSSLEIHCRKMVHGPYELSSNMFADSNSNKDTRSKWSKIFQISNSDPTNKIVSTIPETYSPDLTGVDEEGNGNEPDNHLICKLCKVQFPSRTALLMHQARQHSNGDTGTGSSGAGSSNVVIEEVFPKTEHIDNGELNQTKSHCEFGSLPPQDHFSAQNITSCPVCKRVFEKERGVTEHISVKHRDFPMPFRCPQCNKGFFKQTSVQSHIIQKHSKKLDKIKSLSTPKSTVIGSVHGIRADMIMPTNSQIISSTSSTADSADVVKIQKEIPDISSIPSSSLTHVTSSFSEHLMSTPASSSEPNLLKKHLCPECTMSFSDEMDLQVHCSLHHGENDGMSVVCFICRLSFLTTAKLSTHYREHHLRNGAYKNNQLKNAASKKKHLKNAAHKGTANYTESLLQPVVATDSTGTPVVTAASSSANQAGARDDTTDSCSKCPMVFRSYSQAAIHLGSGVKKCSICNTGFPNQATLDSHQIIHKPGSDGGKKCIHCNYYLEDELTALKHFREVHPTQKLPLRCSLCDKQCVLHGTFAGHLCHRDSDAISETMITLPANMRPEKPAEEKRCPSCYISFQHDTALNLHYTKKHGGKNQEYMPFKCSICEKGFISQCAVDDHVTSDHWITSTDAPLADKKCPHCSQKLTSEGHEFFHFHTSHPEKEFPFCCFICQDRFVLPLTYIKHVQNKHKYVTLSKREMDVCFLLLNNGQHHVFLQKQRCPFCVGPTFRSTLEAEKHLKDLHCSTVPLTHNCPWCSEKFYLNSSFVSHVITKHNDGNENLSDKIFDIVLSRYMSIQFPMIMQRLVDWDYNLHLSSLSESNAYFCLCCLCKGVFQTIGEAITHMETNHGRAKIVWRKYLHIEKNPKVVPNLWLGVMPSRYHKLSVEPGPIMEVGSHSTPRTEAEDQIFGIEATGNRTRPGNNTVITAPQSRSSIDPRIVKPRVLAMPRLTRGAPEPVENPTVPPVPRLTPCAPKPADICKVPMVTAGVFQPTPSVQGSAQNNKKVSAVITVNSSRSAQMAAPLLVKELSAVTSNRSGFLNVSLLDKSLPSLSWTSQGTSTLTNSIDLTSEDTTAPRMSQSQLRLQTSNSALATLANPIVIQPDNEPEHFGW